MKKKSLQYVSQKPFPFDHFFESNDKIVELLMSKLKYLQGTIRMDFLMPFFVSQDFGHLEGTENPHPPTHLLPLLKRIS
jgi:hypothetical protein